MMGGERKTGRGMKRETGGEEGEKRESGRKRKRYIYHLLGGKWREREKEGKMESTGKVVSRERER